MANLNAISVQNLAKASGVLDSVSGRREMPRLEYPPFVEEAVAGAALALEKGHPHALRLAKPAKAEDWLDPTSFEGRHFHRSVARVLGGYEPGAFVDMSPKGVMQHIVTDALNTTLANRMELAIANSNPVMMEGMDPYQSGRVEEARIDPGVAADIRHESAGAYDKVSSRRRMQLVDVFHELQGVSDVAKAEIDRVSLDVDAMRAAEPARTRLLNERLADFKEEGVPLFRDRDPLNDMTVAANWRAQEISEGSGRPPMNELEAGVAAHVAVVAARPEGQTTDMSHDARVSVMVDVVLSEEASVGDRSGLPSPLQVAMRIEGLASAMRRADDYSFSGKAAAEDDFDKSLDMQCLAHGEPASMSPKAQMQLFQALHDGVGVPALTAARLQDAVRDISAPDRSAGMDVVEPVRSVSASTQAARSSEGGFAL